ncbi:hypothetical protein ABIC84_001806 [Mucilaginibacter sp. 3215]
MTKIKLKLISGVIIVLSACNIACEMKSSNNEHLSKLIFSSPIIKKSLNTSYDLEKSSNNLFKVIVSRRDRWVRISIYKLLNKDELGEYPSSFFLYRSNVFLCYDGSEIVYQKRIDSSYFTQLKKHLGTGSTNDNKVIQFDIDSNYVIKLNEPAINPFDLEKHIKNFPLVDH